MSATRRRGWALTGAGLGLVAAASGALALRGPPREHARDAPVEPRRVSFASAREQAEWTMRVLDEAFEGEARDAKWARAAEEAVDASAATEPVEGIGAIQAECRSTMCRVRVGFDGPASRRALQMLLMRPGLNTSGYHGVDPDDPSMARVYVSRVEKPLADHPHLVAAMAAR